MKKFTLLLVSVLTAFNASAQTSVKAPALSQPMARQRTVSFRQAIGEVSSLLTSNRTPAAKAPETGAPISETPDGVLFDNMYVTSNDYGLGFGSIYARNVDGGVGAVVEGSDGNIWIKAPISEAYVWMLGTPWMKAEKAGGDTIVMHTPQLYAIDAGDPYYAYRMTTSEDGTTFVKDTESTDIRFTWRNDTLTQVDDCLVGLGDADGNWFYMGDYNLQYTVNPDHVAQLPEGLYETTMKFIYNDKVSDPSSTKTKTVSCFFNADEANSNKTFEAYFGNFEKNLPDGYAKALMNTTDGTITFQNGQYLGIDVEYNSHIYLRTADARIDNASDGSEFFNFDPTNELTFIGNNENDTLKAEYPASLVVNCGRNVFYTVNEYVAPRLVEQVENPATPSDPLFTDGDLLTNSNWVRINFSIPLTATDGSELNEQKVFYNIYLDDAVYTLTPTLYGGLTADMTDIPYGFSDTKNYDIIVSGDKHQVYIFAPQNYSKIGVQTIYRGGNEEHKSNIVYVTMPNTSGIETINGSGQNEVKDMFDVSGRRISTPVKGINIIRKADGTVSKVLVK